MKTLNEIKHLLTEHKQELKRNYRVNKIGLFGSYVLGKQKKRSDLDILVEFDEPVSLLKLVGLENYLKEITGINVDVIPKKDVRPELQKRIFNEVVFL